MIGVMLITVILVVIIGILTMIKKQEDHAIVDVLPKEESQVTESITEESENSEIGSVDEELGEINPVEDETVSESTPVTFSSITSVLKYEMHPEIEALLDVERFDKELKEHLLKKGLIIDGASHEGHEQGIFLVKSTPYITYSLEDKMYLFDLQVDDGRRSMIMVSVSQNEEYAFSVY